LAKNKISRAKYIRKLKLWGVEKNSNSAKWTYIARKLKKRELEGKDSETYINGQLVPHKKLKKEASRYDLPRYRESQYFGMQKSYNRLRGLHN
jgi:hypothetical protein